MFSVVGFYSVGEGLRVFAAGVFVGFIGLIASLLSFSNWTSAGVAAASVALIVAFLPSIPVLSMRFAKLPMPELPTSPRN